MTLYLTEIPAGLVDAVIERARRGEHIDWIGWHPDTGWTGPEVDVTGLGAEPDGVADVTGLAQGLHLVRTAGLAIALVDGGEVVAFIIPAIPAPGAPS
jgi:hypothetical protein